MKETLVLFLLIHSPLVGPFTWGPVAEILVQAGYQVVVPELRSPLDLDEPYWQHHVEAVGKAIGKAGANRRVMVVGHSGAGPLLPAIGEQLDQLVAGYIFVDTDLPQDGASRLDLFGSTEAADSFRNAAVDGLLPKWEEKDLHGAIPHSERRGRFAVELVEIPLRVYEEKLPVPPTWPAVPCAYVHLSSSYDQSAHAAKKQQWLYKGADEGHFYPLNDPKGMAQILVELSEEILSAN